MFCLRALATGVPIREVEGKEAEQAKVDYTGPGRWPFMWQAYIRQLSRRIDIQSIAPEGWGGANPVPSVEDLRGVLSSGS